MRKTMVLAAVVGALAIDVAANRGTRQLVETKARSMLPHEEGDHARAGRGGRGRWRTPHERRHLVPWAQKAERIGVPAPHHGRVPGGAERAE
jgi:hypothetical protein